MNFLANPILLMGGSVVKNTSADAGDVGWIPGSGRSLGEENGNLLHYSCLGNPMDKGVWWATLHGIAKSWTRLSDKHFHFQREFITCQSLLKMKALKITMFMICLNDSYRLHTNMKKVNRLFSSFQIFWT